MKNIRVLIVDDSPTVCAIIKRGLQAAEGIEVIGMAPDPYVARDMIVKDPPDVVTLDIEMPRMDGLTFLRILMQHHPLPVVVISSLAQHGSRAALEALEAGAVDVLAKPDGTMSIGNLGERLSFHVKAAAAAGRVRRSTATTAPGVVPPLPAPQRLDPRQLIVVGSSTGGVEALRTILPRLPRDLPPIAVVQHISAHFSRMVAERLDTISALDVREAGDDEPLRAGECVIAPGDFHLVVEPVPGGFRTRLLKTPPIHHCRPAVDVLFRAAAEAAGDAAVAVLLTGMGSDGAIGMQAVRAAGGATIAQDEATCVVYGMPRAAVATQAVQHVVPLPMIPEAILTAVATRAAR